MKCVTRSRLNQITNTRGPKKNDNTLQSSRHNNFQHDTNQQHHPPSDISFKFNNGEEQHSNFKFLAR